MLILIIVVLVLLVAGLVPALRKRSQEKVRQREVEGRARLAQADEHEQVAQKAERALQEDRQEAAAHRQALEQAEARAAERANELEHHRKLADEQREQGEQKLS